MNLQDPLMIMFGVLAAAAAGGAAGFVAGTTLGRTRPATPLPTTVKLTREQLSATCAQLDKASKELNDARRPEMAGTSLVLRRRLEELASALGSIGHKAKKEGAA